MATVLVDPARQHHVATMLTRCRAYKDSMINLGVNIALLAMLAGTTWAVLAYRANNRVAKPTADETEQLRRDVVSQAMGRAPSSWEGAPGMITGLPSFGRAADSESLGKH